MIYFHIIMLVLIAIPLTLYHLAVRKFKLTDEEMPDDDTSITMYRNVS